MSCENNTLNKYNIYMTLEELTGKQRPVNVPQTAKDVELFIVNAIRNRTYEYDGDLLDALAQILAGIGNQSLNSSKQVGTVKYADGPLLARWDYVEGKRPFFIKDNITGKQVADPRVVLIGKFAHKLGSISNQGHEFMYDLYVMTGKYYHSFMSDLSFAWDGIATWQY